MFVLEKPGRMRNFKYKEKDYIRLSIIYSTKVSDTSFLITIKNPADSILTVADTTISNNVLPQNDTIQQVSVEKISDSTLHSSIQFHTDSILAGTITKITDTSLIINRVSEVHVKNIYKVHRSRWGYSLLQSLFLSSGLLYVSINTVNGVINNDSPVVPKETLIISGSLVGAGLLLTPLTKQRHKIDNESWRVTILDFTF